MPQVSVIMAAYNAETTIQAAIQAVLCQTMRDFELLVCDDASTDNTCAVVQTIAAEDSRVRLLRSAHNCGAAAARNHCLREAKGAYIAIMDADDLCSANRLAAQIGFLEQHPTVDFVGLVGKTFHREIGDMERNYPFIAEPNAKDFLMTLPFVHASLLFRRKAVRGGYPEGHWALRSEDYAFLMERYAMGMHGANIADAAYYIREDAGTFQRRKYRYRWTELCVKWRGFCRLGLMPRGILYALKPLAVGLVPEKLLSKMKENFYDKKERKTWGKM